MKKKNHQKKELVEKVAKKKKLLLVAFVVVGLLLVVLIVLCVGRRGDAARFSEAAKKKDVVASELIRAAGTPSVRDEMDVCFNSEQGPYDNGKLWCQTATAVHFTTDVDESKIRAELEKILKANDLFENGKGLDFTGAKKLPCRVEVLTTQAGLDPGHFFKNNDESKLTVVMACVDRAKAKHYPYID